MWAIPVIRVRGNRNKQIAGNCSSSGKGNITASAVTTAITAAAVTTNAISSTTNTTNNNNNNNLIMTAVADPRPNSRRYVVRSSSKVS